MVDDPEIAPGEPTERKRWAPSRNFVRLSPLGSKPWSTPTPVGWTYPKGWRPLADAEIATHVGVLLQHDRTGNYALYSGGHLQTVPSPKVAAALAVLRSPTDFQATPFADDLKAWIKRMGYSRDQAANELRAPRSTLDGWCAGRPPALEGTLRRLMELIEAAGG